MTSRNKRLKWNFANARKFQDVNPIGPSYPSEVMVKIFASPYYSNCFKPLSHDDKVLDVGCGAAQNLKFFADRGCEVYGTEVTSAMIHQARENASRLGFEVDVSLGENHSLPFDDEEFDIVLSVNTIHYQEGLSEVENALSEFKRVLKIGGRLFLVTTGPRHEKRAGSQKLGPWLYKVKNYDFRSNDLFAFFEDQHVLQKKVSEYFDPVETGAVTESYSIRTLDFMWALAVRKSQLSGSTLPQDVRVS